MARDKEVIGGDIKIVKTISDDNRSYHVSSMKIKDILGLGQIYSKRCSIRP